MKCAAQILVFLLCTVFTAPAQEFFLGTGAIFYPMRVLSIPTNSSGFITLTHQKPETKKFTLPGRFWMKEDAVVWQIELSGMSDFSQQDRKKLIELKMDQVRLIISFETNQVLVLYPKAKAYVEAKLPKNLKPLTREMRFTPGEQPPEGLTAISLSDEVHNGRACEKYRWRFNHRDMSMTFWLAKDLKHFPIEIELVDEDKSGAVFTMVNFDPPDESMFKVPPDFKLFKSEDHLKLRQFGIAPP